MLGCGWPNILGCWFIQGRAGIYEVITMRNASVLVRRAVETMREAPQAGESSMNARRVQSGMTAGIVQASMMARIRRGVQAEGRRD